MFSSVASGLTDRLTEGPSLRILAPAFAFWAGGFAAVYYGGDSGLIGWGLANLVGGEPQRLPDEVDRLFTLNSFEQFIVVIGVLVPSALAVDQLVFPVLRWLEGYLPSWLGALRRRMVARQDRKRQEAEVRLAPLKQADHRQITVEQRQEYQRLDHQIEVRTPRKGLEMMPTALGNILRAAETRPRDKYGLDSVVCWPRLWLIMPEPATKSLGEARAGLDSAIRVGIWGVFFVLWSVWAWWALPVGIVAAIMSYRRLLTAAATYGDLIESAFDVYRLDLFQKAGWPVPAPDEELSMGNQFTRYLWRRPSESSASAQSQGPLSDANSKTAGAGASAQQLATPEELPVESD